MCSRVHLSLVSWVKPRVRIPGEPAPPLKLNFDPASINFGTVPLNTVRSRSFTIQNSTGVPVRISIQAAPANMPFSWPAFSGNLAAGAQRRFEVQFRPRTPRH